MNFNIQPNDDDIKLQTKQFKRIFDVIALALLFNSIFASSIMQLFKLLLKWIALKCEINTQSIYYINCIDFIDIILYAASFLMPAYLISKYADIPKQDITFKIAFPPKKVAVFFSVQALLLISGIFSNIFLSVLEYSLGIRFISFSLQVPDDVIGCILVFISSVIVPAIVEEILFRKVILNALLPYGKTFSIITSAVLFAIMHCNPSQLIYPFCAGILFALIALSSKSVIPSMLLHALNNALSLSFVFINKYVSEDIYTSAVLTIQKCIIVIGLLCILFFFRKDTFKSTLYDGEKKRYIPIKNMFTLFLAAYVAYAVFLMLRWIYIV